ncbi:MAG: N-acetyl-gamma-glutamyl-phosphate reductase [Deltaproteobacteria bacterium]|nr:N-acetyl-gamma-glutamyl-phosphate reductase [Deltaproteobacteria bacterium]MDL1961589.1 N-acetyl-gamma-glutamyl-phosphate reductase [Deltaproteobacteria bacterium]
MLRTAIVGGSGYTGIELLRILKLHPRANVVAVTSRKYAGHSVGEVFPSLHGYNDLLFTEPDVSYLSKSAEWIFTAVPHKAAMSVVPQFLDAGLRVIDLSADFRLRDRRTYETWYQAHTAPEQLDKAVYGLPEIYRKDIAHAQLVANPGCYPTGAIIPLVPLLHSGIINSQGIIADSKSGASGAGRSLSLGTLYCEVNEGLKAYKVAEHRHMPEIEQELSVAAGKPVVITFTPHLVPMTRGILTTIYARLAREVSIGKVLVAIKEFYKDSPFVRVFPEGAFPDIFYVRGSNFCDIGAKIDRHTNTLVLVSAIDNLVKGASGQAVQNLNIMAGLEESLGLDTIPLCP